MVCDRLHLQKKQRNQDCSREKRCDAAHRDRGLKMPRMVWAELGEISGLPIRIFKNQKAASLRGSWDRVAYILRSFAVTEIRRAIWLRDGKRCTHCGNTVTWQSMEMHERIWRGRGGEVSVVNGCTLCSDCHADSPVAGHGNRKPQWKKQVDSNRV
jgi:hypothetical protein